MKKYAALSILICCLSLTGFAQPKNQTDNQGEKHGPWEVRFEESNTIKYAGNFIHGVPEGKFTYYFPNGKIKTISIFTNKGTENEVVMYYPSGVKLAEGKYLDKKKVGPWKFFDEKGILRSEDYYVNGEKNGLSKIYNYEGALVKEISYLQDVEHGPVTEYFPNGKVMKKYQFEKGSREGEAIFYHLNGKVKSEGSYQYGVKQGWWTEYLDSGNIWKHEQFEKGKLIETRMINGEYITYFENGIPASVYNFKAGKKNGPFREYYQKGSWMVEADVSPEGEVVDKRRFLDGEQLKKAGKYIDDQLHGPIQYFSKSGELEKIETYKMGELVDTKLVNE